MGTVIDKIKEAEELAVRLVSKAKEEVSKQLTAVEKTRYERVKQVKEELVEVKKKRLEEFDKEIAKEAAAEQSKIDAEIAATTKQFATKKNQLLSVAKKQLGLE